MIFFLWVKLYPLLVLRFCPIVPENIKFSHLPILRLKIFRQRGSLYQWYLLEINVPFEPLSPRLPWIRNRVKILFFLFCQKIRNLVKKHSCLHSFQENLVIHIPIRVFFCYFLVFKSLFYIFVFHLPIKQTRNVIVSWQNGIIND